MGTREFTLPPSRAYTGKPTFWPTMSQSAMSMAEMAAWLTPLRVNSVARYIATHRRSISHAVSPTRLLPSHSMAAHTGAGVPIPSPSPTIPSSVATRAKVQAVERGVVGTSSVNASTALMRSPLPASIRCSSSICAITAELSSRHGSPPSFPLPEGKGARGLGPPLLCYLVDRALDVRFRLEAHQAAHLAAAFEQHERGQPHHAVA